MKTPIQQWINEYKANEALFMHKSAIEQAIFARDRLASAIARNFEEYESAAHVVGEHHSKSVKLPVVLIERPGLAIVMRDNFHNVSLSIKRDAGAAIPFLGQIAIDGVSEAISGAYCEGFPAEWLFPAYQKSPRAFTVHVGNRFDAYTIIRLAALA